MRALLIATFFCAVSLPSLAAEAKDTWVVEKGDTLTSIAHKHKVSVADLQRWNGLRDDVIRIGQTLTLTPPTRSYEIRTGDTLGAIAAREGTTIKEIVALNPGLKPNRIAAGQSLVLPRRIDPKPTPPPEPPPPECPGRIVQLERHAAYRLRNLDVAWTTALSAHALQRGFDHLRFAEPKAPRVRVLDASRREGGPLGEHRSHRDGRDVDITYFQKDCDPAAGCPLRNVKPHELDVARQWTLIRYWLEREDVEYLFIDHALQRVLYEHAKEQGIPESKLDEWFQYPRSPHARGGIIRHWEGHENHLHVRFWPASCAGGCCTQKPSPSAAIPPSRKRASRRHASRQR